MLRRLTVPWPGKSVPALEEPELRPAEVVVELPNRYGLVHSPVVAPGDRVVGQQKIAESNDVFTHAPITGTVREVAPSHIVIESGGEPTSRNQADSQPKPIIDAAFLRDKGVVGEGGAMFPAARKLSSCSNVHTLVLNGVECEPGITIDHALLTDATDSVRAGAEAMAAAVGAEHVVLALARERSFVTRMRDTYPFDILTMPRHYPAGAERLIVRKLSRCQLAARELPTARGYLVHNIATLRAIGLAVTSGRPVIDRPLSVARPDDDLYRNVIVPVGVSVGALLAALDIPCDPGEDVLVAGGMMMGNRIEADTPVNKGTTSIIVLSRKQLPRKERACIRCGACNAACPLKLHPIGMVERLQTERNSDNPLQAQLEACFLCGACSAVCPSYIPLVQHLKVGKQCLKKQEI